MHYLLLSVLPFLSDQFCKRKVEKEKDFRECQLFSGKVILTRCHNEGVFLNFLEKKKNLVLVLTSCLFGVLIVLFALAIHRKESGLLKLGLALMTGGAASNLWDRCKRGYVVDYLTTEKKPLSKIVFNLADISIFSGGIFALIDSMR